MKRVSVLRNEWRSCGLVSCLVLKLRLVLKSSGFPEILRDPGKPNIHIKWETKHSYKIRAETYSPLGQLVITNHGRKPIRFDSNLASLFDISQDPKELVIFIKRMMSPTAYFIHCDLIDGNNNLFNGKRSDLLAKFDVRGKPFEKVRYDTSLQFPFRGCSTGFHVNSITLSVRDQDGELFDFKGMPTEFELELI